jgi:hypothetical protein
MLESLVELSREPSTEKRREVLQHVSQLFSEGAESFSAREKVLFGEILVRLLDQVPIDDRIALSNKIARVNETPRDVALKLANDVVEVAAPVLEFSSVLTNQDLADVAASKGQGHLMALSRRSYLPEVVTEIIVERGEDKVLTSLARNAGAQFSQSGFTEFARKTYDTLGLGEVLANRTDLPNYVADMIMPLLSDESRKRLSYLLDRDQGQVQTLLQSTQAHVENSMKYLRRERVQVRLLVADIREGKRGLSDALAQLVREKRVADIAHVVGEFADIPISQVANAFHKTDASAFAAACKVAGVENDAYEQLSLFRCEKLKLPATSAKRFLGEYEAIDKATAERAIRFHKVRIAVGR